MSARTAGAECAGPDHAQPNLRTTVLLLASPGNTHSPSYSGEMRPSAVTLVAGAIVALSSGTNYLYSAYGPQLSQRLGLSVTQANVVGASGNLGMYTTGLWVGPLIDRKGPRVLLFAASIVLLTGWTLMYTLYTHGPSGGLFSSLGIYALAGSQFLTGVGSSMGNGSASNGVARSFTLKRRATALSVIFCSTGLSAFAYSSAFRLLFPARTGLDRTPSLLVLLIIGSSFSMLIGAIFVRPRLYPIGHSGPGTSIEIIVPPPTTSPEAVEEGEEDAVDENSPLVAPDAGKTKVVVFHEDIHGWALVRTWDFWLLFGIEGLLSGIGLMYINNLGVLIHALSPSPSPTAQTNLVSLLSICNASGRVLIATLSDHFVNKHGVDRIWWTVPVSGLFVLNLLWAGNVEEIQGWKGLGPVTASTGIAYGSLFGLLPVLTLDWFGLPHYSSNNGIQVLGPAIFGQSMNYLFGRVFDSHTLPCYGNHCYKTSLNVAAGMAATAFALAFAAGFRRRWKVNHRKTKGAT